MQTLMKKYILIYLLCFSSSIFAQNHSEMDSLKTILPGLSGKEKVKVLRDLCYYGRSVDFAGAVSYGEQAIAYATEMGYQDPLGASYQDLGSVYLHTGRYETALDFYQKAEKIFKATQNQQSEAFLKHNTGLVYSYKGDYQTALQYLLKALELKNSLGGVKISSTLNSIGEVYRFKEDFDKALEYCHQALEAGRQANDKSNISGALNSLAIIYRKNGDFEKALEYRMEAIALSKEIGDDRDLATSYNNLGELYDEKGELNKAILYYRQSLEIKARLNHQKGIAHTSERLASVYAKLKDFKNADNLAKKSLAIANEIGYRKGQLEAFLSLSQIYQAFGKYEQALLYHTAYTAVKDSLFDETKEVITSDMEAKYQTSKREAENSKLKLETEHQLAIIDKKNQWMLFGSIGLVALFIFISLVRSRKHLKRQKKSQENFSQNLIKAQEDERTRIARELHDSVGQQLTLIKKKAQNEDQKEFSSLTNTALEEVRSIARALYPATLKQLGLSESIEQLLYDLDEEVDMFFSVEVEDINQSFDENKTLNFYRFIQESVNNVIKHAKAKTLKVGVAKKEDMIEVFIEDNGCGFKNAHALQSESLGLKTMAERIRILSGTLSIYSKEGEGTTVTAKIPVLA